MNLEDEVSGKTTLTLDLFELNDTKMSEPLIAVHATVQQRKIQRMLFKRSFQMPALSQMIHR